MDRGNLWVHVVYLRDDEFVGRVTYRNVRTNIILSSASFNYPLYARE